MSSNHNYMNYFNNISVISNCKVYRHKFESIYNYCTLSYFPSINFLFAFNCTLAYFFPILSAHDPPSFEPHPLNAFLNAIFPSVIIKSKITPPFNLVGVPGNGDDYPLNRLRNVNNSPLQISHHLALKIPLSIPYLFLFPCPEPTKTTGIRNSKAIKKGRTDWPCLLFAGGSVWI